MSRTRIALLALVALALVGGGVAWWLHTYKRVEKWIDLPRTGEAASNPLFGLRLALENDGRKVRAWRQLDLRAMRPGPRDVIVHDGDPRQLDAADTDGLLDWLRSGGHLVIGLPSGGTRLDDVLGGRSEKRVQRRRGRLLATLGVTLREEPSACVSIATPRSEPMFCAASRFDVPIGARRTWGDEAGAVFARIAAPQGGGSVDVLASLVPLSTEALEDPGNAAFVHQLFPAAQTGTIHLVHVTEVPSLWGTLLREGWRIWLPLGLLLAGWLLARMRRFGPLLPSPERDRRSLLEHMAASGEHQWRYGQARVLHAAMRDAFLARLRRRDPQTAALEGEARVMALVERLRVPASHLREALTPPDPRDRKAYVARIKTLVRMRNRL